MAGADLAQLLESMDADAPLVQRHIWLIALFQWIRGNGRSAMAAAGRVDILLDVMDARPHLAEHLRLLWQKLLDTVDDATLLSDYGFDSRNAFVSELIERLQELGAKSVRPLEGIAEHVVFTLPRELARR